MRRAINLSKAILFGAALAFAGCSVNGKTIGESESCAGGKCDEGGGRGGEGGSPGNAPALDTAGPTWNADWTLLVFAANDDRNKKLVKAFDQDMDELQYGLGGSSLFRILVQRDYAQHQKDAAEQPRPTERFGLYREQRFDPISMKVENPATGETGTMLLAETDTTDPNVIKEFLVDGIRAFPAKRYWVIITGHGDSWNGLAFDSSSGAGKRMPLAGLHDAFAAAANVIETEIRTRDGLSGSYLSRNIDVVQFDVCRLGAIEAAATFSDSVDFMIASQEVVPDAGHPYSALRWIAQDHSGKEPKTVVKEVVTDYVRAYVEGVSTVNRAYVGRTVSAVGLDLTKLKPLLDAITSFRDAVLKERPEGFSCKEVFEISKVAQERAHLVDQAGGRSALRDADPAQAQQDLDAEGGRASVAAKTSVDLISLFETIAGKDRLLARLSQGCPTKPEAIPSLSLTFSDDVRDAAMRVLDIIGRPHIWTPEERCGSTLMYDAQYRKLVSFKSRSEHLGGDSTIKSPFVVEAHKVDGSGQRATGVSVLWGDPYDLLFIEGGSSALDRYRALPFEQATGWTQVFGKCVKLAEDCRSWSPGSGTPNPCDQLE